LIVSIPIVLAVAGIRTLVRFVCTDITLIQLSNARRVTLMVLANNVLLMVYVSVALLVTNWYMANVWHVISHQDV
jgi:hypothetical protein